MILSAETREHVSAGGAGLEHPPRQDTLTFFEGSALNYGNYLDEVWTLDKRSGGVTVADLNDGTGGQRHFCHCNTLYHVYALTDETGAIAEAVQSYDAYGKISALITGSGTDTTWFTSDDVLATNPNVSAIGNTFFYTGQKVDPETGLGYFKLRYYSYDLGRFFNRNPWGYFHLWPSLYDYADCNPTAFIEPLSEVRKPDMKEPGPLPTDVADLVKDDAKRKSKAAAPATPATPVAQPTPAAPAAPKKPAPPLCVVPPLGIDYGYFCGEGRPPVLFGVNDQKPVDCLDACCRQHDYCYAKYKVLGFRGKNPTAAQKGCDIALAMCAQSCFESGALTGRPCEKIGHAFGDKSYRQCMVGIFVETGGADTTPTFVLPPPVTGAPPLPPIATRSAVKY